MAEESSEPGGLDWSVGSFVFEQAFAKLATSLRWMFWGIVLQVVGAQLAVAPFVAGLLRIAPLKGVFVLPGLIAMAAGGIVLLIGEQKCLHLDVPLGMRHTLPGHRLLQGAYWCHLGSWILRLARNWIGKGPVAVVLLPLQLIGFILLLLFLRKTADVLARQDLRRHVDIIFGVAAAGVLAALLIISGWLLPGGVFKNLPGVAAYVVLALPILWFLVIVGLYAMLLWRMAAAAAAMAHFLGSQPNLAGGGEEPFETSEGAG